MTKFWREVEQGKIRRSAAGWIYSEEGATNISGFYLPPRQEKSTGKLISIERRPTVRNCPTPPGDPQDFVQVSGINKVRYYVGERFCKKCPHRLKGGFCQELRRLAHGGPSVEQQMTEIVDTAMKQTNAIINGVVL